MELLDALNGGIQSRDERDGRVPYMIYGVVKDVDTKLGRVRARAGAQGDGESTEWLDPAWPGSIEAVPVVGEPVFIQFVDADPNRGVYWWHPTSTTKNRAQDFMLLGTTMCGMYNFLVDQFNQLRTDFNTFASTYTGHVHPFTGTINVMAATCAGTTSATTSTQSATTALATNKGKANDGSVVNNQTSSVVVLSGRAKIK